MKEIMIYAHINRLCGFSVIVIKPKGIPSVKKKIADIRLNLASQKKNDNWQIFTPFLNCVINSILFSLSSSYNKSKKIG
jgi:hypothetical protein